jgi:hypothetical protein
VPAAASTDGPCTEIDDRPDRPGHRTRRGIEGHRQPGTFMGMAPDATIVNVKAAATDGAVSSVRSLTDRRARLGGGLCERVG